MAIEIREVVIRASISKNTSGGRETYISKSEVAKMQEKLMAKILGRVRDMLEESRSFR